MIHFEIKKIRDFLREQDFVETEKNSFSNQIHNVQINKDGNEVVLANNNGDCSFIGINLLEVIGWYCAKYRFIKTKVNLDYV